MLSLEYGALIDTFASRLAELGGEAIRASLEGALADISTSCTGCRAVALVVPDELRAVISRHIGLELLDGRSAPLDRIAAADACVVSSEHLIAESGSVAILTRGLGERRATILPDRLFVLALSPRIYRRVSDFMSTSAPSLLVPNTTLTMFSGPSRTGDVENVQVRGVHGPRLIKVYVITR